MRFLNDLIQLDPLLVQENSDKQARSSHNRTLCPLSRREQNIGTLKPNISRTTMVGWNFFSEMECTTSKYSDKTFFFQATVILSTGNLAGILV